MIKYLLKDCKKYSLEISKDEFEQLKSSKKSLVESLLIEEKLDLIFTNYAEIEKQIFNISLNKLISQNQEWISMMNERNLMNLRIINFLSTTRLYIEQLKQTFSSIYGKESNPYQTIDSKCSEEYDSNLGYRAMEALRNHVLHFDLPVDQINPKIRRIQKKAKFSTGIYSQISVLSKNKKFKKPVLNELKSTFGENIDLILLIRQYLESLTKIHSKVRQLLKIDLERWEGIIMNQIDPYREQGGKADGLIVLQVNINNNPQTIIKEIHIFEDMITRRKDFEDKYPNLTSYSYSHFISNEISELKI